METLHVPAQLIDPLSCNDGWSYIPVSFVFWQNTSRDSRSNRKPFICPGSQPQNCRVCAHNVSWKVNVWTLLRAQSVSAGPSCLMRRRWSEAHLDTPPFPQQGQSWHSVISESTCFLLLALALCPASRKQTRRKKKKTLLNDGTKITSHTQTSTPATPAQHLLDLVVISSYFPANLLQKKEEKKLLSPAPPLILLIFFFFPPFPPPPLHRCCAFSPVADGSGRTGWRAFEARGIYHRRINRWEIDYIFKCSISSLCTWCRPLLPSLVLPPPSRREFPADFPQKHMLQLWVGCHFSLWHYLLLFSFGTNPHCGFSSRLWWAGFDKSHNNLQ